MPHRSGSLLALGAILGVITSSPPLPRIGTFVRAASSCMRSVCSRSRNSFVTPRASLGGMGVARGGSCLFWTVIIMRFCGLVGNVVIGTYADADVAHDIAHSPFGRLPQPLRQVFFRIVEFRVLCDGDAVIAKLAHHGASESEPISISVPVSVSGARRQEAWACHAAPSRAAAPNSTFLAFIAGVWAYSMCICFGCAGGLILGLGTCTVRTPSCTFTADGCINVIGSGKLREKLP